MAERLESGLMKSVRKSNSMLDYLTKHPPEFYSPYGSTSNLADMSSIPVIREEPSEEQTMRSILQSIHAGDTASVSADVTEAEANYQTPNGWYLVHYAAYLGHAEIVEVLRARGCNTQAKTINGHLPHHLAAWMGRSEVMKVLLKDLPHSNKPNSWWDNEDGFTPLHWAALGGHVPVMQLLVAVGCGINQRNRKGYTALHFAAQYGHTEAVEFLLKNGARPNVQNEFGDTPLHSAAGKGFRGAIQLLLQHGGDVWLRNAAGKTAAEEVHTRSEGSASELVSINRLFNAAKLRQKTATL